MSRFRNNVIVIFSSKIAIRMIQVVQSVILAQLIPPEEWGLIVTAMILIGISKHISEEPFCTPYLVAHPHSSKELKGSVFIIALIRSLIYAVIIFLFAKTISTDLFHQPELKYPLQIFAIGIIISALENPETKISEGQSQFKKLVTIEIFSTLIAAIVAIFIAIKYRSIEALIAVNLLPWVVKTICSHIYFSRNWHISWNITQLKQVYQYGKHFWGIGLLTILTAQGDDFFVSIMGKESGAYDVAIYARSYFWATTLSFIFLEAISRALFPKIIEVKKNMKRVKEYLNKSVVSLNLLLLPSHAIVFFFAKQFILISSGEKWLAMEPYLKIFLLLSLLRSNARLIAHTLTALDQAPKVFKIKCVESIVFISLLYPAYIWKQSIGIAWVVVFVYICSYIMNRITYEKYCRSRIAAEMKNV